MRKIPVLVFVIVFLIAGLPSCKVDNSDITNPSQANFLVCNVSPDAPPLDITINNLPFGKGLAYGNYTPYYQATAGSYQFNIADSSNSSLINSIVNFSPNISYSYFIVDSLKSIKASFVEDDLTVPSPDSVYVRFFNFSPDAGSLSLVSNDTLMLFAGRSFNSQATNASISKFTRMKMGVYKFSLLQFGDSSSALATKIDTLTGGRVYSIFAKGFVHHTGTQAIGIGQIEHL